MYSKINRRYLSLHFDGGTSLLLMNINIVETVQMCRNSICQMNVHMLISVLSSFAVLFILENESSINTKKRTGSCL